MKFVKTIAATILIFAFAATALPQKDAGDKCQTVECYLQSAKIHYKHVYGKTKLREDLYHCIDLCKRAAERFGHLPEVYYFIGTFYAEINAIDTMVAYFDSVAQFCADESIDEKARKNCYRKENYKKKMEEMRQKFWEESYNDGVEYLNQYDTLRAWMDKPLSEDSLETLDSMKDKAYQLAKEDFERALLAKPEDPRSTDAMAVLLEREEDHDGAIALYQKAMDMIGENCDMINKIAYAYIYKPDWENAINWFEKYLNQCEEGDINVYINLSVAYQATGNFEKWYEFMTKALEIQPDNTQLLFNAGQYWFMKMQDHATKLGAITDTMPDAEAKRAEVQAKIDSAMLKSEEFFDRVLEINPQDGDAMKRLGILYLLSQQPTKAVELFERTLELAPNDLDVLDYLGRAHILNGDTKAAIEPYERIVERDPGRIAAWERLAELYQYNKMPEKAEEAKQQAEELKNL